MARVFLPADSSIASRVVTGAADRPPYYVHILVCKVAKRYNNKMPYKVIIAGSRNFANYEMLKTRADSFLQEHAAGREIVIVSGRAQGADQLGERYARERGYTIEEYPADWKKHGRAAGPIRNKQMVDVADGLIAFWDGQSRGTANSIFLAEGKGILMEVVRF